MTLSAAQQPGQDSASRILDVATNLFAEHGFHGVTTRQLAAAAGLNIATVHHHVGTKGELYIKVMERLYEAERELVGSFIEEIDQALARDAAAVRDLMVELVDKLVDMTDAYPARARLYMRRWLDTEELSPREAEQTLSLYGAMRDMIQRAQGAGVIRKDLDPNLLLRSFDWLIYGYFVAGSFEAESWRSDPHDPGNLKSFKTFLHDYLCRMLGL